jgi:kumamolisin
MADERVELPGSYRPTATGARLAQAASPSDEVEVTITLRGPHLPTADEAARPAMNEAAFAAAYGASPDDAAKVKAELETFGLDVYAVSLPTRSLQARGTVAQMEAAFGVTLGVYEKDDQGSFRGREGSITLPAALSGIVTGVFGLDGRRVARRSTAPAPAGQGAAPAGQGAVPAGQGAAPAAPALAPADLESRYSFPPGDGTGQVIAIAEFGGGYFASDVQAFCAKYGRAVPTVTPVSAGSPLLTLQQIEQLPAQQRQEVLDESVEVMMDAEIVAALCPAASVYVYFAPFTQKGWVDLLNAVQTATSGLPVALSVSWGLAEDSPDWSGSAVQAINERLQALSMMGVTACVAAGDDGAGDQISDGDAHVNFPASSPFVLSVGGTMLQGTPPSPAVEVVWWDAPGDRSVQGGGSTGGGVSTVFPRPAWQNVQVTSLNTGSIDGRVVPDVAALAGQPFYDLIFLGEDSPNGGTSAAAPLWASLLARLAAADGNTAQRQFLTPLLYANAPDGQPAGMSVCNDITSGDNRSPGIPVGYTAGPGFDAVSGWGTPIGTALVKALG